MQRAKERFASSTIGKRGIGFSLSISWLVLVAVLALFANLLPLPSPNLVSLGPPASGASLHHLLGLDGLGRDELSRLIYGSRISLVVGLASTAIGLVVGGISGIIAGYFGKVVDMSLSAVSIVFLSFPQLVFLLALVAFMGQKVSVVVIGIGVISIGPVFRVARNLTIGCRSKDYVIAAKLSGLSNLEVVRNAIFPNVIPTLLAYSLVTVGSAILAEALLSFIGLSIPPPTATWGNMVDSGISALQSDPALALLPSLAIFFTVLSLNVASNGLISAGRLKEVPE